MLKFSKLYVCVWCLLLGQTGHTQSFDSLNYSMPMDSAFSSGSLVCKLTGPELSGRLEQLKLEIFSSVNKTEEISSGFAFHFTDDNNFVLKLMDYILAERKCCPFFNFGLTFEAKQNTVVLQISGPPGAKEMIQMFVEDLD